MVGQHQVDHFDMVLQTMQKYHGALFGKELLLMPKVGIRITILEMTICTSMHIFIFSFAFVWFSGLRLIYKITLWHWLRQKNWFWWNLHFWKNLNSVNTFRLCMLKISIWKIFCKVWRWAWLPCHLILEDEQRDGKVQIGDPFRQRLKVGNLIIFSDLTRCI